MEVKDEIFNLQCDVFTKNENRSDIVLTLRY